MSSDTSGDVITQITAREHRIWWLFVGVGLDRIVTVAYFNLEQNPIVLALGAVLWVISTVALVVGAWVVWEYFELHTVWVGRALVTGIGLFHLLFAISNLWAIATH